MLSLLKALEKINTFLTILNSYPDKKVMRVSTQRKFYVIKKHLWSHILGKDLVKSSLTSAEAGESSEPVRNRSGCG